MTARSTTRIRRPGVRLLAGALVAFGLAGLSVRAVAQSVSDVDKTEGETVSNQLPEILKKASIQQHLNAQLPLNAVFTDDHGNRVTLGKYFDGRHPVLLTTVYYNCPMLCSEELDGITSALMMVNLKPGKDFQIVVISIDPTETAKLAAQRKDLYVRRYGHPESANGWHFLVGPQASIDAVTKAVGFGYVRVPGPDGKLTQFAHASSIEIATPEGRVAQYYLGVEYSPKDMLLGLIQASDNKIGSPVENILTYCYRYDPQIDRQSLMIARVVQLSGMATVAVLGSFMFLMFRRDLQLGRELGAPPSWRDENRRNG